MCNIINPVSILVPVYGVEKYIERCARSLFEQTYDNIEYIFVDDCTPDKSIEVLKRVLEEYPHKKEYVHIIRHESNRGVAAARNTAVENCKTEFLMYVDSDDWIEDDTVESCMEKQKEGDYDIVAFDFLKHNKQYDEHRLQTDILSPKDFALKLIDGRCVHAVWCSLVRKKLYIENNISFIEGVNMAEDFLVMPRLAYCANRVANFHRTLYHYCVENVNSYSNSFSREKSQQQLRVHDELINYFIEDPDVEELLYKSRFLCMHQSMKNAIAYGDMQYACDMRKMLDSYPPIIRCSLPWYERVIYFMGCNKLSMIYIRVAKKVKSNNKVYK